MATTRQRLKLTTRRAASRSVASPMAACEAHAPRDGSSYRGCVLRGWVGACTWLAGWRGRRECYGSSKNPLPPTHSLTCSRTFATVSLPFPVCLPSPARSRRRPVPCVLTYLHTYLLTYLLARRVSPDRLITYLPERVVVVHIPCEYRVYLQHSTRSGVSVCVAFAISSECRSVCVALVAGAGRRCTYTVCTCLLTHTGRGGSLRPAGRRLEREWVSVNLVPLLWTCRRSDKTRQERFPMLRIGAPACRVFLIT